MAEMMARAKAEDFDPGLPPVGPPPGDWPAARPRVVVIGGGFAGLRAVQELRWAGVEVTLLDRRNFHLFQPLLYQVASGALSPGEIAYPLRDVLARQPNARVLMADVAAIDLPGRRVRLRPQPGGVGAAELPYDWLIVATGAGHSYFGHDGWARHAPGLKTLEDALEIRRRILTAFEAAELKTCPERRLGSTGALHRPNDGRGGPDGRQPGPPPAEPARPGRAAAR